MLEPSARSFKHEAFDLEVSTLGWGMWRFRGTDLGHAQSLVEAALESGITLFDTADIYGPDMGSHSARAKHCLAVCLRPIHRSGPG